MPKKITEKEFDTLLRVVEQFPDGASIEQIQSAMASPPPRRTLQRRLAMLVANARIGVSGRGRASRYRSARQTATVTPSMGRLDLFGQVPSLESQLPLSKEAVAIKTQVRAPLTRRQPVGYNRTFLDGYRPNETFYLSETLREKLTAMGCSTVSDRPAGTFARKIFDRLLIDLSWNSSRLEGNTYTLLETERLLQLGEMAEGKGAQEAQMIRNHKAAIEMLVEQAAEIGFNRYTILNLHALLSDNLLGDSMACGRLRSISVSISGAVFHPLEVPQLIEECFDQVLDTAAAIEDPFEQAFFVLVHLPYLQPFEDVNKRVSRLAANLPLNRHNLCPVSFVDVPDRTYVEGMLGVYELNRVDLLRDVFEWAYRRSCARYSAVRRSLGEPDAFRLRFRDEIARCVAEIVRRCMNKVTASKFIQQEAALILDGPERSRLIEIIETETMNLHEGNIARFRLRPSEYRSWRESWGQST